MVCYYGNVKKKTKKKHDLRLNKKLRKVTSKYL